MIRFVVPGEPVPQGSMAAYNDGQGRARVVHKAPKGLAAFRADCRAAAATVGAKMEGVAAIYLEAEFVMGRPKAHYGTGRNEGILKLSAPKFHTGQRPDGDKLLRALFDALHGVCFRDDGQVVMALFTKRYVRQGEAPHTEVFVDRLAEEEGS